MTILGLFTRKTSNRSQAKNASSTSSSSRTSRKNYHATAILMDRVGRFEVNE